MRGSAQKSSDEAADTTGSNVPEYEILDNPQVDLSQFKTDEDGYIHIFNGGTSPAGEVTERTRALQVDHRGRAIKFNGSGGGEAQDGDGEISSSLTSSATSNWVRVESGQGSNSGDSTGAEVQAVDPNTGEMRLEPIYISAPEAQYSTTRTIPMPNWARTITGSRCRSDDTSQTVRTRNLSKWNTRRSWCTRNGRSRTER